MPPKYIKYANRKGSSGNTTSKRSLTEKTDTQEYLVIVESPSKCQKIESFLGARYKCIASIGHLRTITGLKSIDVKNGYKPEFTIIKEKEKHIREMAALIQSFRKENIILATDDDREGEAIAWNICEIFKLSVEHTPRIIFQEITKEAILNAIQHPRKIDMNTVYAQHARQIIDIFVGFKISPLLWKYLYASKTNSLSAGRCQTPALRLIYENYRLLQQKILEKSHRVTGYFTKHNFPFVLCKEFQTEEEVVAFLEQSVGFPHELSVLPDRKATKSAPRPFNTSALLQTASNMLSMSPKETMHLCQLLYQEGFITYMRTDSTKYSEEFIRDASVFIVDKYGQKYLSGMLDRIKNTDKLNPHEAIRITHIDVAEVAHVKSFEKTPRIMGLYKLIWRNTIESCMTEATYSVADFQVSAPQELHYKYSIETPIFLGWKQVSYKKGDDGANAGMIFYLKSCNPKLDYQRIESSVTFHNRHSHYTEAGLIQTLEELGIGRPSTFASLVETIQDRGYVKKQDIDGQKIICQEYFIEGVDRKAIKTITKEKQIGNERGKLVIQPIGVVAIELLMQHFDGFFSYDYTKNMEEKLDIVKETDWMNICDECYTELQKLLRGVSKKIKKLEYKIDDLHTLVFTSYGLAVKVASTDKSVKPKFLSVKRDLITDIEKIRNIGAILKGCSLEDLLDKTEKHIGYHQNYSVIVKKGPYGNYMELHPRDNDDDNEEDDGNIDNIINESIQETEEDDGEDDAVGEKKKPLSISLATIKKELYEITMEDVTPFLPSVTEGEEIDERQTKMGVLRILNSSMDIRMGRYGKYVFYQKKTMKRPEFLNIKKCKLNIMTCPIEEVLEWLHTTYPNTKDS